MRSAISTNGDLLRIDVLDRLRTAGAMAFFPACVYGATLAAAEQDALTLLSELYIGCTAPFTFYSYGERSNGTWWADVEAECKSVN